MNRRNDFVGICLALLLAVSPGCSDSDDGGSGMTASQSQCVSFTAAQDPASSEVSARDGVDSTCDTASVEFVITDVNGIYGAAWTIDYDETVVRFVAMLTDNSFLGSDGVQLISLAQDASGRITLSISRDGTQSTDAVDFVGTEILGTLFFSRTGVAGSTALLITNETLLDNREPPVAIPGVSWTGGTLLVN